MLQPILSTLNAQRIVLASTSPRRKMLLDNIGLKFEIVPSKFEENLKKDSFSTPLEYVKETARQKILEVTHRLYHGDVTPPSLIIGADTIVTKDNKIFEKPSSREDAVSILSGLSGSSHTVYTAVVLVTPKAADKTSSPDERFTLTEFYEETEVMMGDLNQEIIQAYVDTGEPMDKAGGYGIHAFGSTLIKGVHGDYFNVVGFPLHSFAKHILQLFKS